MFFQALGRRALGQLTNEPGIAADAGAFTFTGQVAGLSASILGVTGAFTLTGQDAAFLYVSGSNLTGEVGSFVLTGQDSSFGVGMPAGEGSFSLTGQDSRRTLSLAGTVGAFALTGIATTLRRGHLLYAYNTVAAPTGHVLFAPLGALSLGGSQASLVAGETFAFTGQDIAFGVDASFSAGAGAFVFTFPTTSLSATVYPSKIRAFPRVARGMRGSSRGGGMTARPTVGRTVRARAFGG